MKRKIRNWLYNHEKIYGFIMSIFRLLAGNSRIKGLNPTVFMKRTKIVDSGKGNTISIGRNSIIQNCTFRFYGNNNKVIIGENCRLSNLSIWFEDDTNCVTIGNNTSSHGTVGLACIEGCKINIGEDCMFSGNIEFRTGDSHSVTDLEGNRINHSKDISIGNHVWIGQRAFICKGTKIPDNSIVAACSVVTKQFEQPHVVVAGNPAKITKENIDWKRERI